MTNFIKIQVTKRQLIEIVIRPFGLDLNMNLTLIESLLYIDNLVLLKHIRRSTPELCVDYNVNNFFYIKYPIY